VRAAIEEDIDVALDRLRARIAGAISEADADSARVLTVFAEVIEGAVAHYRDELLVERTRFLAGERRPGAPVPRLPIIVDR
jgi:hypothetical protein